MAVGVVVVLEPVVIDHLDAEPVAAMLFAKRRQQALFAQFPTVEQRASVAPHPAEQRLALLQLDAFLTKLLHDVKKHPVPILDLVADGEIERLETRTDQFALC